MGTSEIDFSLLLPTRGRLRLLHRLLDSVVATSTNVRNLEVVFYIDDDDHETRQISHSRLSLVKIVRQPGATMGSMNQACYEVSRGRYVMLINDDAVFRTPGWDHRVLQAADNFPDGIVLIYGNDLDQREGAPTFPILPRAVCSVLGEVCPRGYRNLHIESHLLDIFRQLAKLGYRRICYLNDVVFEHMHYVLDKATFDSTYAKKNQRADDLLFIALDDERAFKARLLANYIDARVDRRSGGPAAQYVSTMRGLQRDQKVGLMGLLKRIFYSL